MRNTKQMTLYGFFMMALLVVTSGNVQARDVVIDFESDSVGFKGASFQSVDSPILTFSDTDLLVDDFGIQSIGQGLLTLGSNLGLNMNFSTPVDSLSMVFGNDDPDYAGDRAVLTVFSGLIQVGQVTVIYNKNDAADETIGISGVGQFERAHLIYLDGNNVAPETGELVDNVRFNPVPEPNALPILGTVCFLFACGRRRLKLVGSPSNSSGLLGRRGLK